jgi:hypothetical protein
MGDTEDARRAAATHVPRSAWPQSGGLVGERPGEAMSFAAAGGHSYRAANRVARFRQTENCRDFSGKMTRAATKLNVADVPGRRSRRQGEACNA